MAKVAVVEGATAAPLAALRGRCEATGLGSAWALSPEGYSLAIDRADLEAGAELSWGAPHGDEAVFVLAGELRHEGRVCPRGGAVVVESDARAVVRAEAPTTVLHFSPALPEARRDGPLGPPEPDGHGVHVVGPRGWFASGDAEGVDARWFADATCPRCRLQLLRVARGDAHHRSRAHHHTEDELIFVEEGEVSLGSLRAGVGDVVVIPGGVRYALTSGGAGLTFLNYRADQSYQVYDRSLPPIPEAGLARGGVVVGDLR
jgi:quercetin dioxygenase-like cupin family protein